MTDYDRLRAFNGRIPEGDALLALPEIPSVEMMVAAANRRNVYREGDRLADYIVRWDFEPQDELPVPPASLVERFGIQEAFAMSVLADAWAGCVSGFREWTSKRGREGDTPFVTSWLRALPLACPPGGWPGKADDVTPAHREHALSVDTSTTPPGPGYRDFDELGDDGGVACPSRCTGIMALRARQRESTALCWASVEELVDHSLLPFVPGYSKQHYFEEDERAELLASAMWDAAVTAFRRETSHGMFPAGPHTQPILLSHLLCRRSGFRRDWPTFHADGPFGMLEIETDLGHFRASTGDNGLSWEAESRDLGLAIRRENADLRLRREWDRLSDIIAAMDRHKALNRVFTQVSV